MKTRIIGAALAATVAIAIAGCSGSDAPAEPDGGSTAAAPDQPATTAVSLAVTSTSAGDVITDANGATLYMFDPDEGGTPTCSDSCAINWPPLIVDEAPSAGAGADAALIGTAERADGTTQATYGGWPLYYFVQDAAAGDVNGQGVGGNWWVVGPDGQPIRD